MQPDMTNPAAHSAGAEAANDREGAMARADLYKLANYSLKLFKQLDDNAQLESWVQAKVTKAADYIASVYHYLEYEMKFTEYAHQLDSAEMVAEGAKSELKNKLLEAKAKIAELKKAQADKITGKQVNEGHSCTCEMCGGSGVVEKEIPEELKAKVRAYNTKAKAMAAAIRRVDKNKNGIPDALEKDAEKETDEGFEAGAKSGSTFKTRTGVATKTDTGVVHKNTSHSDEEHGEPPSKVKQKSSAEKKADKEKEIKLPKHKGNTWGMKGGEKFGKKEEAVDEMYGQGVYEGNDGNLANNAKPYDKVTRGDVIAGRLGKDEMGGKKKKDDKKVKEALKGDQHKLDVDNDDDIEADDLADLRAGKKAKEVKEGSTGDYSAKKAAAGKDIGKPGKNFAKIAKKAGGGEKGEKIAGAVLKKLRAKESVEPKTEVIAESAEVARLKELTQKLLG
jgi:hypothetical protein